MPCKHYKDALMEAAALGAEVGGELRAHLDVCADCRGAFEQERALFSSIDAGLHVTANAEVPASLLPRVRAGLEEKIVPQRSWFQLWIFAAASVALALAIFQFALRRHADGDNQAKQTPRIEALATNAGHQNPGPSAQIASSVNRPQTRVHSTFFRSVASSQPEVLVPPDEREALARFVATLQGRDDVAVALLIPVQQTKDEPASLESLQIKGLEIKLLEERQTEMVDRTEEKQ